MIVNVKIPGQVGKCVSLLVVYDSKSKDILTGSKMCVSIPDLCTLTYF